ncbi:MAG: hypothetical protein ABEH60_00520 [Halonotius sp.]
MRCRSATVLTVTALLLVVGLGLGGVGSVAAADTQQGSAFVVDLQSDGNATVTLVVPYDLTSDAERQAFEELRADPTAITAPFEQRLSRIAARTATDTDREMRVGDAHADFETSGGQGIIRVSVDWIGLGNVSGNGVTLSEPFASGYQPNRPFVVHPPSGYTLTETSHEPAASTADAVRWASGASLAGFSTTFTGSNAGTVSDTLPTPLPTALLGGVVLTVVYTVRRRWNQAE